MGPRIPARSRCKLLCAFLAVSRNLFVLRMTFFNFTFFYIQDHLGIDLLYVLLVRMASLNIYVFDCPEPRNMTSETLNAYIVSLNSSIVSLNCNRNMIIGRW